MRQRIVTATRHSAAPITQVWELLADIDRWSTWAPVRDATLEQPGADGPNGVGAVRSFRTLTGMTREEIVRFDPPHHVGYVLLSGPPLEDYRSDVRLEERFAGGTTITWTSTFWSTWLWHRLIAAAIRSYSRRLAAAAAREARAGTSRPR